MMNSLCEKYYDKNLYSYCADNPMKYGDSIWFTSQMNTDVQLSGAKSMSDVENSDHLFVLTDDILKLQEGKHVYGGSNEKGGKVAFIQADLFTGVFDRALGSFNYGTYTATHEFGHLSGLEHVKYNNFNLMTQNGFCYELSNLQLKMVRSQWENSKLNKGYNYELTPVGTKRPNRGCMGFGLRR